MFKNSQISARNKMQALNKAYSGLDNMSQLDRMAYRYDIHTIRVTFDQK